MSIHGHFIRPAISVRVSMFMHFKMTRIHSESLADRMFEREKGRRPSPSPKWRCLFSPAGLDPTDPTRVRGDVQRAVLYSQDLVLDWTNRAFLVPECLSDDLLSISTIAVRRGDM